MRLLTSTVGRRRRRRTTVTTLSPSAASPTGGDCDARLHALRGMRPQGSPVPEWIPRGGGGEDGLRDALGGGEGEGGGSGADEGGGEGTKKDREEGGAAESHITTILRKKKRSPRLRSRTKKSHG